MKVLCMKKEYFLIIVLCTAAYIVAAEQDGSELSSSQAESACKSYELCPIRFSLGKKTLSKEEEVALLQRLQAVKIKKKSYRESAEAEFDREHFCFSN